MALGDRSSVSVLILSFTHLVEMIGLAFWLSEETEQFVINAKLETEFLFFC